MSNIHERYQVYYMSEYHVSNIHKRDMSKGYINELYILRNISGGY